MTRAAAREDIKRQKPISGADVPENSALNALEIKNIVAIGSSTGGPRALQDVLPGIPGDIPAAFLVVQHMPPGFTKSLAERLDNLSQVTVKEAEEGDIVRAGHVYIAPGDYHMLVKKTRAGNLVVRLSKAGPAGGHRPSVNIMMDSLSDTGLTNIIGVILTGMGSDGCEGLKKIKMFNNGYIIAQDEKTSIVYGMPRAAVKAGIVDKITGLSEISAEIVKNVGV